MNIVICDDEANWLNNAQAHVATWATIHHVDVSCTCLTTTQQLHEALKASVPPDLILLDVKFVENAREGFDIAKRLRVEGDMVPIVFLTSDPRVARYGYLVEAMGFLDKPIDKKLLGFYLSRVYKHNKTHRTVRMETTAGIAQFILDDLCYAEVQNHIVRLHTRLQTVSTRMTLEQAIRVIDCPQFLQIHRSYAVHVQKILGFKTKYPYEIHVAIGREERVLPVGRTYLQRVTNEYASITQESVP